MDCSFCGKNADAVRRLIAGPAVFICDECVECCNAILAAHPPDAARAAPPPVQPVGPWWRHWRLRGSDQRRRAR